MAGLFVDEWVESVPDESETTGVAFQHDRPTNQAPQSMLLAAPPNRDGWSVDALADVVSETMALARSRAVDAATLRDLGHVLPALTYARDGVDGPADPRTVSVDLTDLLEVTEMESTTTWRRLEPRTRDERLAGSLRASVHDPAWSLARQWQLGEFDGVDAGSPIRVDLSVRRRPVTAYGFGDERGRDSGAYTPESPPLEVLAERERVSRRFDDPDRNLRDAADAGAQFLRLLATHDESFDYAAADFADAPALDAYDEVDSLLLDVPDEDLDAEGERFAAVVSGRALDGDRLYHVLTKAEMGLSGPLPLPNESLETDDGYDQSYLDAVSEFREWYGEVYSEPDGEADAWDPERLEYEFEVAAGSDSDRRSLSVEAYEGGGLDWYDFAARKGSPPEPPEDAAVPETETVTTATRPTPVRFGGMPARRWWAFEDGEVNVPNVDAAAEDISRLLLAEYALVSGADWFRVPVELPVGTLATVEDLTVTDTFGRETEVRPTAGIGDSWRLFDFTFQAGNDVERSLFCRRPSRSRWRPTRWRR
ncbi:hypothetical protein [Halorussus caseinilyticus]|uniref:Uncharacterized protein n=1 Tax=Halorussus caseinilyticus TaxID=3034025 RepID=A0ABD5WL35_9EURY